MENKLYVAVTGGADAPREALDLAFVVGYEVVRRGHILLNGGAKGVDCYAVHGGDKYGEETGMDFDGEMIAFRPRNAQQPASSRYTEVRVIGNTHAERSDAVVRNCDILIILSGGSGTMDIAKRAQNYGKPVIPIGCSRGAALELWHKLIEDDGKFFPYRNQITTKMLQSLNPLDYVVEDVARLAVDLAEEVGKPPLPQRRELQVFLCHSSGDKPAVKRLYQRLIAERGIAPWLDEEKLLPGENWGLEIKRAVKTADIVIVCLSRGSVNKEGYVQKEIKQALDIADEKPEGTIFVVPLKLETCDVPERLSTWQWVNYYEEGAYNKLLLSLRKRAHTLGIQTG